MEQGAGYDDRAVTRLALAVAAQAAQDAYSISDGAWEVLQSNLEVLRRLTPAELGIGSDLTTDDPPEPVVRGMRTLARFFAAVFVRSDDPVMWAGEVAAIVGNPRMSVGHWRQVLHGRQGDPSVARLRRCARYLRDGFDQPTAAELSGVSMRQARGLGNFLGSERYHHDRLLSAACDAVEGGLSVRGFAARWNDGRAEHLRIGKSSAHQYLVEARLALGEVAA